MGNKTSLFSRHQPGGVFIITDQALTTGDIWFVDSGSATGADSVGAGQNPDKPFLTLDYAIGVATANQGDIIYLMPGHAENLTAADDVDLDKAGISVVGIGSGSLIPTFSCPTNADGSITIDAANVSIKNIKMVAVFATGVTTALTLTAAADYCTLDGLIFRDTAANQEFLIHATIATTITDLVIKNCNFITAAGTMSSSLFFAGTSANVLIENNYWFADCSASVIDHLTDIPTAISIIGNHASNVDGAAGLCVGLKSDGAATGYIANNLLFGNKNDSEPLAATNDFVVCQNFVSNTLQASGVLNPASAAVP